MIEFKNLEVAFKDFNLKIPLLSTGNNGFVKFEGANGSGKSTIFKILMKTVTTYKGDVFINGKNIVDMTFQDVSRLISYVPQTSTDLPNITGEEFVQQGLYLPGESRLQELIEYFDMRHLLQKKCNSMSGGEKQLCIIVRNLALKKEIIILDEADSFLSKKNKTLLYELVSDKFKKNLVLISSHQSDLDISMHSYYIQDISDNEYQLLV